MAIGVPYDVFWHLTPKKLESFYKADEIKRKRRDEEAWLQGMYFVSALNSTVGNMFSGKSSKKNKYIEKPFLQDMEINQQKEEQKPLTEEEVKKQTEQLFLKLQIMGANFNLSKEKKIN